MGYRTVEGLPGKVYVPEADPVKPKKHPCPDCFDCAFCDDDRCRLCLKRARCVGRTDPVCESPDSPPLSTEK